MIDKKQFEENPEDTKTVSLNTVEEWQIENTTTNPGLVAHPFHIHVNPFQIVEIFDPNQTVVTYVTDRTTASTTGEGATPNPNHSGIYRNPTPLADGTVIVAHSTDTHGDKNLGTRANPSSRYTFRLKTLKKSGNVWVSDQTLTSGISKRS